MLNRLCDTLIILVAIVPTTLVMLYLSAKGDEMEDETYG
jgi:hypothetical protein